MSEVNKEDLKNKIENSISRNESLSQNQKDEIYSLLSTMIDTLVAMKTSGSTASPSVPILTATFDCPKCGKGLTVT